MDIKKLAGELITPHVASAFLKRAAERLADPRKFVTRVICAECGEKGQAWINTETMKGESSLTCEHTMVKLALDHLKENAHE